MANEIALDTANKVEVVESLYQMTLPAAEDIAAGDAVRLDTSNGKWTKANGSSADEARVWGVAVKTAKAGMPVTAIRRGVFDGFDVSAMAWDDEVYLSDTDGRLSTVAGTTSVIMGRVIPGTASLLGADLDKVVQIDITA